MSDPNIPPQTPPQTPPPVSYQAPADAIVSETDPNARNMAMVTYILGITLWIGPLIMYLIKKDDPATTLWTKQEMKKALNWGIMLQIIYIICVPLNLLFCLGFIIILGLTITNIVFVILNAMKANKGQSGSYPYIFPIVK